MHVNRGGRAGVLYRIKFNRIGQLAGPCEANAFHACYLFYAQVKAEYMKYSIGRSMTNLLKRIMAFDDAGDVMSRFQREVHLGRAKSSIAT